MPNNNGGVILCGKFGHDDLTFDSITLVKQSLGTLNSNLFIFKFNSSGAAQWGYTSQSVNPTANSAWTVEVDTENNVYVAGSFFLDMTLGNFNLSADFSGEQMYLIKFNSAGDGVWAKTSGFGTNGSTIARAIDIDSNNNIYLVESSNANNINFSNNVVLENMSTTGSFFVTKYNSLGNAIWAIGNFFEARKIVNYLKALISFFLGTVSFYIVIIGTGIAIDILMEH